MSPADVSIVLFGLFVGVVVSGSLYVRARAGAL